MRFPKWSSTTVPRRVRLAAAGASAGDLEFVAGDSYALSGNASGAGGNDTLDGGPGFRDRVTGDNRSEKNGVASGDGGNDLVVDSSGDFDVLTGDNASFGPSPTVGEGGDDVLRNPRRGESYRLFTHPLSHTKGVKRRLKISGIKLSTW